jgi:hypothetical protein
MNTVCADFETGVHQVTMIEPGMISFWPAKKVSEPGAYLEYYSVVVEESRTKTQATHCAR